jgi:hypothetical protein
LDSSSIATLIPLTVFAPRLAESKTRGRGDAGRLASRYGSCFEEKWFRAVRSDDEAARSGDIQSLADLGNSMAVGAGDAPGAVRLARRDPAW